MNREIVPSPTHSSQSAEPATLAFTSSGSTPARVIEQLDKLTTTLETMGVPGRGASAAPQTTEDEECLESYLQRYMQQLTGKTVEKPVEKQPSPASLAETSVLQPMVEPAAAASQRLPVQAPEDRERITVMRELANDSARRAMAESTQIQLVVKTRTTYLAAKALSLVSCTLALAYLPTRSTVALTSATAFFGIACLLGIRFLGLCRKLRRLNEDPA